VTDRRSIRVGLVLLVLLPIVTAVVRAIRNDWFPIGDNALLFIRTRDVWTEHHPLLGSWTSASLSVGENMNNPGSMYDWLIAPFAHLLPPGPAAAFGVASVNIVAIIGVSVASRRIGGWVFERAMLVVTAVLTWSMGSEMLFDIWQANALVLPFLLFLVLVVGCAANNAVLLPWAIVVGSLLLQTHISYAYIFVFLIGGGVAAWAWQTRQRGNALWPTVRDGLRGRQFVVSGAVFFVLWLQPIIEQLFGAGTGNIARLVGNSGGGSLTLGGRDATRIVAAVTVFPTWWSRDAYTTTVPITRLSGPPDAQTLMIPGLPGFVPAIVGLALVIGVLVALTWLADRADLHVQVVAGVVSVVALIGSVLSLSLLTIGQVGLSPHHVRWIWPLIAFVHLVIAWMAVTVWRQRHPDRSVVWATPLVAIVIVVFTTLNLPFHAQPSGPTAAIDTMPVMRRIEPDLDRLRGAGPVLFDVSNLVLFEPYSATMMMWMQERGIEFRVDDEVMVRQLGNSRRADGSEAVRVFQLQGIEAITYVGNSCPVGVVSALTPQDEARASVDAEALAAAVADGSIDFGESLNVPRDDVRAALDLVLDGTVPELIRSGFASVSVDEVGVDALARIETWAFTSYGLFADGLESCA
jgi:hypothetical protein